MYLVRSIRTFIGTNSERTAAGLSSFLAGDEYIETDTGDIYIHDGMTWANSGGGGSVGGSDTQVQYNDGGSFGGDAGFIYDASTTTATLTNEKTAPGLEVVSSGSGNEASILFDDGTRQYALGLDETSHHMRLVEDTNVSSPNPALYVLEIDLHYGYISWGSAIPGSRSNAFVLMDTQGGLVTLGSSVILECYSSHGYSLYADPLENATGIGMAPVSGDTFTAYAPGDKQFIERRRSSDTVNTDFYTIHYEGQNSTPANYTYAQMSLDSTVKTAGSESVTYDLKTSIDGSLNSRFKISPSEVVFNDVGDDVDFRVEGDANQNLIFADAGLDSVGVRTGSPATIFHVYSPVDVNTDIAHFGDGTYGLWVKNTAGSGFAPYVYGVTEESDDPLIFGARIAPANDTGTRACFWLDARQDDDTAITTRPLVQITNLGVPQVTVAANGQVGINTTSPIARLTVGGHTAPSNDNTYDLGRASYRWDDVYATNGTIQTSDKRNKKFIKNSDLGLEFINSLRPVSFVYKKIGEQTHKRRHYGLIAQEVLEVLNGRDFAGYIHDKESDFHGLRYTELIAPLIAAIQQLDKKIEQLTA